MSAPEDNLLLILNIIISLSGRMLWKTCDSK